MDFACVTLTFTLIFSFILIYVEHKIHILKYVNSIPMIHGLGKAWKMTTFNIIHLMVGS